MNQSKTVPWTRRHHFLLLRLGIRYRIVCLIFYWAVPNPIYLAETQTIPVLGTIRNILLLYQLLLRQHSHSEARFRMSLEYIHSEYASFLGESECHPRLNFRNEVWDCLLTYYAKGINLPRRSSLSHDEHAQTQAQIQVATKLYRSKGRLRYLLRHSPRCLFVI